MVIRRKRTGTTKKNKKKQQEGQKEELHQLPIDENNNNNEIRRGFDEVLEIAEDVVGDLQMDGLDDSGGRNLSSEKDTHLAVEDDDQGNTTPLRPLPLKEACEVRKMSAIAQMALRINDEMSAKKRLLEKGLMRRTRLALHGESSGSQELYDGIDDCEKPNNAKVLSDNSKQNNKEKVVMALHINDEMSAKKSHLEKGLMSKTQMALHEESSSSQELYDDIDDCETPNHAKVLSNASKQKNKEHVISLPKATLVAEDQMRKILTRSGKRKLSAVDPEQPILEHDHEEEEPTEQLESQLCIKRNGLGATILPHITNTNTGVRKVVAYNEQGHEEEEPTEQLESEPCTKRNGLGSMILPHITNTDTGVRKVVEYNEHGQPIGQYSAELASYMGSLTRQMVPIVHEKWKNVPKTLKEELWRRLEVNYVLEPMSKRLIVNSFGDKWRSFRSTLTTKYILPFKDEPDRLVHPPVKYGFIKQEHWDTFVKSRLNEEFQALHKAQSERCRSSKYPHRMGRRGYADLKEKMKKSKGITPDQLDRCLLWKKARQNKDGEYADDVTREQVEIIDELKKRVEDGSLVLDENNDVLSLALGTPERPGRVRATGKFVSHSTIFFQNPRSQTFGFAEKMDEQRKVIEKKLQEERVSRLRVEDQLLNTQETVSRLEETLAHFIQNGKAPTSTSKRVRLNNNETFGKSPTSVSNRVNVIINETLGKMPTTTSNRVSPTSNRVVLTSNRVSLNNNETLGNSPASTSNRVFSNINETSTSASSQSMAWENDIENLTVSQMPASDPKTRVDKGKTPTMTSNRVALTSNRMAWENDIENLTVSQMPASDPKPRVDKGKTPTMTFNRVALTSNRASLNNSETLDSNGGSAALAFQTFYSRASQRLTGAVPYISIPVDAVVFGADMELYLDLDDIRYMCQMEDLSANCIMVYMRHLYDKLTLKGIQDRYEFINPSSLTSAKDNEVSDLITERLQQNTKCEWVFLPYNPEGAPHWLLVVINMLTMSCYWLDPSDIPATLYNIKSFITVGLKSLQKGGVRRPSPIWYNTKCPKQKRDVECGFYIMKYMREIIDESSVNIFKRKEPFSKSTYEKNEIDEVRHEWMQTVDEYI